MIDPVVRQEAVIRHQRIRLMSDVLALKHKHASYFMNAGPYDTLFQEFETFATSMKVAREAQRKSYKVPLRDRVRRLSKTAIQELLRTYTGLVDAPSVLFDIGKVKATREKNDITGRLYYRISVGWMWMYNIHDELYLDCNTDYGTHVLLEADKVRVNHKWIEVFEVKTFHVPSGEMRSGYVARTKTPERNCAFHENASVAVKKAQTMMMIEMNLDGKGKSND